MAVSRGAMARDIRKEVNAARTSSGGASSGGGTGSSSSGPSGRCPSGYRWNGSSCVKSSSSSSATSADAKLRAELDKVDWNAVGRLMGGGSTSGSSGMDIETRRNLGLAGGTGSSGGSSGRGTTSADWGALREKYTKTGAGSSGVPWDMMTDYEKRAALDQVNWSDVGKLMAGGGAGGGSSTSTGGGGGTQTGKGGGSSTSGGGSSTTGASADNITQQLLDALAGIETTAKTDINTAGNALLTALGATDPMAMVKLAQPNVGVPEASLAGYLGYIGAPTSQVQGAQDYAQQFANAYLGDVNRFQTGAQQAQDVWRSRQADIARQNTNAALQRLALNVMAARLGIQTGEAQRRRQLQDTALQLALQYGKANPSGGSLGFIAPSYGFQTVTLPNGQVVSLPSNFFGG